MIRLLITFVALALTACGPQHGTEVVAAPGGPAWTQAPDLFERTERVASTAAGVWGGSPATPEGWRIEFETGSPRCGSRWGYGCTNTSEETITLSFTGPQWAPAVCVEATELAHEIGHVVLPDAGHTDPRWHDRAFWERVRLALRALTDEPDCQDGIDAVMANEIYMAGATP